MFVVVCVVGVGCWFLLWECQAVRGRAWASVKEGEIQNNVEFHRQKSTNFVLGLFNLTS